MHRLGQSNRIPVFNPLTLSSSLQSHNQLKSLKSPVFPASCSTLPVIPDLSRSCKFFCHTSASCVHLGHRPSSKREQSSVCSPGMLYLGHWEQECPHTGSSGANFRSSALFAWNAAFNSAQPSFSRYLDHVQILWVNPFAVGLKIFMILLVQPCLCYYLMFSDVSGIEGKKVSHRVFHVLWFWGLSLSTRTMRKNHTFS